MYNRLKHPNWLRYIGTLIIGGLLVAFGYIIGESNQNIEAQEGITRMGIIHCKGLIVSDWNPEHGSIQLGILEGSPIFLLSDHADSKKTKIQTNMSIKDDHAAISLTNLHKDGSNIVLLADRNESALLTMKSQKRITDALNLFVGPNGAQINLENEVVNFKHRKR